MKVVSLFSKRQVIDLIECLILSPHPQPLPTLPKKSFFINMRQRAKYTYKKTYFTVISHYRYIKIISHPVLQQFHWHCEWNKESASICLFMFFGTQLGLGINPHDFRHTIQTVNQQITPAVKGPKVFHFSYT
jgi:hypothetical protein